MKRYGALLAFVLVAAFILAACGSSGSTINVTLSDTGITPTAFTAPIGAQVNIIVKNNRTDTRDCAMMDVKTMKLYPGQAAWALTDIAGGTTKSQVFTAPSQATSYQFDCGSTGFSGNPRPVAANMVATFDVK